MATPITAASTSQSQGRTAPRLLQRVPGPVAFQA